MAGPWVAPDAVVVGDVSLEQDVSIWYGAVLRGDSGSITIGRGTNVQDRCVIHEKTVIGADCTIGHGAIVHGCSVGDRCMVGMGAIVLTGAVIGDDCLIGAGALVTGKTVAPAGSVLLGSPARVVGSISQEQRDMIRSDACQYVRLAQRELPEYSASPA